MTARLHLERIEKTSLKTRPASGNASTGSTRLLIINCAATLFRTEPCCDCERRCDRIDLLFRAGILLVIYRSLFGLLILLVLAAGADAGRYQRTKDRQIRVWNEHPEHWDEAIWTGERDENGYGTGRGVLTWYRIAKTAQTGTFIPSSRGHNLQPVRSFSGSMSGGRFEGTVLTTDDEGKHFHASFADGSRVSPWTPSTGTESPPARSSESTERSAIALSADSETKPPAEGPTQVIRRSATVEAPTQDSHTLEVFRPPSSLRASYVTGGADKTPPPSEPKRDAAGVDDLKQQTQTVLSQVRSATADFRDIDSLDSVQSLPPALDDSIRLLRAHARDVRSHAPADAEIKAPVETADALSTINESTHALATKDAATADSELKQFLKDHPAPPSEEEKDIWHYLTSARTLCERQRKAAEAHLQRAQSLASADEVDQALKEYMQANHLFPLRQTADKIRQLSARSATMESPQ